MDRELLSVAGGTKPADVVITGGRIVNVYTGEIYDGGVAISNQTIARSATSTTVSAKERAQSTLRGLHHPASSTGISIRKARHWQSVPLPKRCWHTAPPAS